MVSEVHNMDCVEYMRTLPDNHFDIAICDPPYGDAENENFVMGGRFGGRFDRYKQPTAIPRRRQVESLQEATNYPPNQQQQADWNPHTRRNVGDKIPTPVNHAYGGRFSRYSGGGTN